VPRAAGFVDDEARARGEQTMWHKPRRATWREVMTVLEDTHEALVRVLLMPGVPLRAQDELRAVLTNHVRPILEREGRRLHAIPP
jgi:hypothetical protein